MCFIQSFKLESEAKHTEPTVIPKMTIISNTHLLGLIVVGTVRNGLFQSFVTALMTVITNKRLDVHIRSHVAF
jgi:hypothetical protein